MIENKYMAILQHDTLKMRHPLNKDKIVTLYRIIATKTFYIPCIDKHVERYEIGGYVESISNLDHDVPTWVDNSARVFDSALLLSGSAITENALIFGNAKLYNSLANKNCRVHGNATIVDSKILSMAEVRDDAKVESSIVQDSSKIFNKAEIINSTISVAASVHDNAVVVNSAISDICDIYGDASIKNCVYSGRVTRKSGEYINETLDKDLNLTIYEELDENTHKEYK